MYPVTFGTKAAKDGVVSFSEACCGVVISVNWDTASDPQRHLNIERLKRLK